MSKYKEWSGRPPPSFDVSLIDDHDTGSESEIALVRAGNPDSYKTVQNKRLNICVLELSRYELSKFVAKFFDCKYYS